jgi:hypothetical protein
VYWLEGAVEVHWLLLATDGSGLESKKLRPADEKPSGVRAQSWALCEEARRRGFSSHRPHLFFYRNSHGERITLTAC